MNHYRTSDGQRVSKAEIDRRVHMAKAIILDNQIEEFGYNFCSICKQNDCLPITCMHIISVDECQKTGRTELAWDTTNMVPAGIPCHKKHDNVELHFKNKTA